jgi:hypothetical protein
MQNVNHARLYATLQDENIRSERREDDESLILPLYQSYSFVSTTEA